MSLMEKTGVAMYTVHKTVEKDMAEAFIKLADLGYHGVEFYGELENFPVEKVKNTLSISGLAIAGWHLDWRRLHEAAFYETMNHLQNCGCKTAVVQCLGGKWNVGHSQSEECKDRWLYYIDWLNQVNEKVKKEGLRLAYHNHEHEFTLSYNGKSVYDLMYENLSTDIVMEFDSGNCIEGGGDPLKILKKYRDRQMILHLKPYSYKKGFDVVLGEKTDANDWQEILHQPWKEFEWLLVESENAMLPEMTNAAECLKNLKKYI